MEFILAIAFEKSNIRLSTEVVGQIRRIFTQKQVQVGTTCHRTIKVLITDSGRRAKLHDDEVHTITMLVIKESTRAVGGIVVSFMEDITVNLQNAVDRLHLFESTSTCFVRRN